MNVTLAGGYYSSLTDGRVYFVAPRTSARVVRVENTDPQMIHLEAVGLAVGEQAPKETTTLFSVALGALV